MWRRGGGAAGWRSWSWGRWPRLLARVRIVCVCGLPIALINPSLLVIDLLYHCAQLLDHEPLAATVHTIALCMLDRPVREQSNGLDFTFWC